MFKIFGGKGSKDKAPTAGDAIQKLRETEEMLQKKSDFFEKKIDQDMAIAKKNAKTNKRVALQALKRKKRYEKQLQQIDGTLTTIEQQRNALEDANTNTEVLKNMGQAAKALKKAHADMDIDQVHDMMDDIAEQQDVAKEISEAISNPVAFGNEFDDDELEAELADLEMEGEEEEQAKLDEILLNPAPVPTDKLPDVPQDKLPAAAKSKKVEKDDDLADLEKWAAAS